MHTSPALHNVVCSLLLLITSAAHGQDTAQVSAALEKLKPGVEAEEQLEALQSIATSLDPRIPAACLPMLHSPGASVQRNAARAIGSRWWQIPPKEVSTYVEALKAHQRSEYDQLANMARRGIGLLERNYTGDMFSRSKSKDWVIYERHGKPCLIDTHNHTEELLGPEAPATFMPAYGNTDLARDCHWHPKKEMVALAMLDGRHTSELWIWRQPGGIVQLDPAQVYKVLQPAGTEFGIVFFSEFKEWHSSALDFEVQYTVKKGDDSIDRRAMVRWDAKTSQLQVLSDKIEQ